MAMDRDEIDRHEIAAWSAGRRDGRSAVAESPGSVSGAAQPGAAAAVRERLERAERLIDCEPDRAAWLLDRALQRMLSVWLARDRHAFQHDHEHVHEARSHAEALGHIGRADPPLARQLGLARRAADPRARLRHGQAALVLLERSDVGLEPAGAGCGALRWQDAPQCQAGRQAGRHMGREQVADAGDERADAHQ